MTRIPQRVSLHDQLVGILREGIAGARWDRMLPSERDLSSELQVSRGTLRKAMEELFRERTLVRGQRGRCLVRNSAASRTIQSGTVIRILTPYSPVGMGSLQATTFEPLAERMSAAGYRVQIEYHPELFTRFRPSELTRLDSLPETAGWVLHFCTSRMQRWFAASGRPCLVMGRTADGLQLSSISIDVEALVRHVVGLFYRRGHRDLIHLRAEFTSFTDQLGSEAFVEEATKLGMQARIVTHPADSHQLCRALDRIITSKPRPTGFYSGCPEHCLTTLCHLMNAGLRIPADAEIISGWDDLCLHYSVPTIAHYRIDGAKLGRKAAAMLLDMLKHGPGKMRSVKILPEFVPGGTIKK